MIKFLSTPRTALEATLMTGMNVVLDHSQLGEWFHSTYPAVFGRVILTTRTSSFNDYDRWSRAFRFRKRTWLASPLDPLDPDRAFRMCRALLDSFPTYHKRYPWRLVREFASLAMDRGGVMGVSLDGDRDVDYLCRLRDAVPEKLQLHGWDLGRYASLGVFRSVSIEWHGLLKEPSPDPLTIRVGKVIDSFRRITRPKFSQEMPQ